MNQVVFPIQSKTSPQAVWPVYDLLDVYKGVIESETYWDIGIINTIT